jgi:uncharacterized protein
MSEHIIERAVAWVFENGLASKQLSIVWHAGEPLVLTPLWYERAFVCAHAGTPPDAALRHCIQTNATLINGAWCDLFNAHAVQVGISLDGPAHLHDAKRRTRAGRGTHVAVMRGVEMLKRHGVPFHVICVVGRDTLAAADELMDFFLANEIWNIGFNIEEIEGVHESSSLATADTRALFRGFLTRVISRVAEDTRFQIREFVMLANALADPSFGMHRGNDQNTPFVIITVSHRGEISTFSPELAGIANSTYRNFVLGSVESTTLNDILTDPNFRIINSDIQKGVDACSRECDYFRLCRGGAPANKLAEHGSFATTETLFCQLTQMDVTEAVLGALEVSLANRIAVLNSNRLYPHRTEARPFRRR